MTKKELLEFTHGLIELVDKRTRARGWAVLELKDEYNKMVAKFDKIYSESKKENGPEGTVVKL